MIFTPGMDMVSKKKIEMVLEIAEDMPILRQMNSGKRDNLQPAVKCS